MGTCTRIGLFGSQGGLQTEKGSLTLSSWFQWVLSPFFREEGACLDRSVQVLRPESFSRLERLPTVLLQKIFHLARNDEVLFVSKSCQKVYQEVLREVWESVKNEHHPFYRHYFAEDLDQGAFPVEQAKRVLSLLTQQLKEVQQFPKEALAAIARSEDSFLYFSKKYWSLMLRQMEKFQKDSCASSWRRFFESFREKALTRNPHFAALGNGVENQWALRLCLKQNPVIAREITCLDLSDCNPKLKALPTELFYFSNLEELDVSHNEIEFIPHGLLKRLPKLRKLNFCSNQLKNFRVEELKDLPFLEELCLKDNRKLRLSTVKKIERLQREVPRLQVLGHQLLVHRVFRGMANGLKLCFALSVFIFCYHALSNDHQNPEERIVLGLISFILGGLVYGVNYAEQELM